jgi:hypothetical protein
MKSVLDWQFAWNSAESDDLLTIGLGGMMIDRHRYQFGLVRRYGV